METEQKSHKRFLQQSWLELEEQFRNGNVDPKHENDIVCYLYHALAKRYAERGFPLHMIRTEDTRNLKGGQLRPDLNLHDRVFVEVKKYPLRDYRKGWEKKQQNIKVTVDKLKQYVAHTQASSSVRVRAPVLAVWFIKRRRKQARRQRIRIEDRLINDDLRRKMEKERERYRKQATLLYGPRKA